MGLVEAQCVMLQMLDGENEVRKLRKMIGGLAFMFTNYCLLVVISLSAEIAVTITHFTIDSKYRAYTC